ncbi:SWIM zinc finger family protein [Caldivirga sp.]|uniref:SWIM zinc finger family protein n=1 Tax=Caldivirga sp. TaxID=2080243 RepID=UPI003D0AD397
MEVKLIEVKRIRGRVHAVALVKSASRPGLWHRVHVDVYRASNRIIIEGQCDCEAFRYGLPCRHILAAADKAIINARLIKGGWGLN